MGRLRSVLGQILNKLKRSASNGGSTNMSIWSTGTGTGMLGMNGMNMRMFIIEICSSMKLLNRWELLSGCSTSLKMLRS
jgi:hypothetical protein